MTTLLPLPGGLLILCGVLALLVAPGVRIRARARTYRVLGCVWGLLGCCLVLAGRLV